MLRSIVGKLGAFNIRRRRFPRHLDTPEVFEKFVDEGVLDCFEPANPFISRDTNIVTMGSCFAQNIARNLASQNYNVLSFNVANRLFTPFALKAFAKALLHDSDDQLSVFSEHWNIALDEIRRVRSTIMDGAVVIITFGMSMAWYQKSNNQMVFDPGKKKDGEIFLPKFENYEMRHTRVEENVGAIAGIIDTVRALNPATKLVLTLSPLPLVFSMSDYPVIAADCISKSTLRIALDETLRRNLPDVYYFPSYELLKWLAPMLDGIWFEDDMIYHIRNDWIAYAMAKFRQYFCVEQAEAPPKAPIKKWLGLA